MIHNLWICKSNVFLFLAHFVALALVTRAPALVTCFWLLPLWVAWHFEFQCIELPHSFVSSFSSSVLNKGFFVLVLLLLACRSRYLHAPKSKRVLCVAFWMSPTKNGLLFRSVYYTLAIYTWIVNILCALSIYDTLQDSIVISAQKKYRIRGPFTYTTQHGHTVPSRTWKTISILFRFVSFDWHCIRDSASTCWMNEPF